MDYRDKDH